MRSEHGASPRNRTLSCGFGIRLATMAWDTFAEPEIRTLNLSVLSGTPLPVGLDRLMERTSRFARLHNCFANSRITIFSKCANYWNWLRIQGTILNRAGQSRMCCQLHQSSMIDNQMSIAVAVAAKWSRRHDSNVRPPCSKHGSLPLTYVSLGVRL